MTQPKNILYKAAYLTQILRNGRVSYCSLSCNNLGDVIYGCSSKAEFDDAVYDMAKIYGSAVVPSFMDRNKLIKLEPKVGKLLISQLIYLLSKLRNHF